jgi:hypothetical protein
MIVHADLELVNLRIDADATHESRNVILAEIEVK